MIKKKISKVKQLFSSLSKATKKNSPITHTPKFSKVFNANHAGPSLAFYFEKPMKPY